MSSGRQNNKPFDRLVIEHIAGDELKPGKDEELVAAGFDRLGPVRRNAGNQEMASMSQIARNLTDSVDGLLTGKRYLIHDRDPLFTDEFLSTLKLVGIESVKLPARSPNLNAYAERFVRSIKQSCLERLILFGETSLRTAVQNFIVHYHSERNHQGLDNRLIQPEPDHLENTGEVQRRERLGGLLNYYYRAAA